MKYLLILGHIVPGMLSNGTTTALPRGGSPEMITKIRNHYETEGYKAPRNFSLLRLAEDISLDVAYHSHAHGTLLLATQRLADCYELFHIVRGAFLILRPGLHVGREMARAVPIASKPQPSWGWKTLSTEIQQTGYKLLTADTPPFSGAVLSSRDFYNGTICPAHELSALSACVKEIWNRQYLCHAIRFLVESRDICLGNETLPFLGIHAGDELAQESFDRDYYEHRQMLESAFVAAFKGIEAFIQKNGFKRKEIRGLLQKHPCQGLDELTQEIEEFLNIRNTTAAHANRKPPDTQRTTRPALANLQTFLERLFARALGQPKPQRLPPEAYLDS